MRSMCLSLRLAMRLAMRLGIVSVMLVLFASLAGGLHLASAQNTAAQRSEPKETGYAIKKPVFGGACPTCPWGAIADIVKAAMKPYGWDIQICYYCAGGPRAVRIAAGAMMATPPANPTAETRPTPKGPVDFGATNPNFLRMAYLGTAEFAGDPEGPRKHLRLVANIQVPAYLMVAVKAGSGITDLGQIVEKRLPVKMVVRMMNNVIMQKMIQDYYGITQEKVESLGGTYHNEYSPERDVDVLIGFGALVNAPEYNYWYQASQKYDLKYLELAPDLLEKLAKEFDLLHKNVPLGLLRGVDRPIPTVARSGTVIYGRTDMPDDFAYTLAKAMDEQQDLLQWSHMNFSYNWRTVWKAFDVPLHPGAARYYKEKGYMK